MSRVSRVRICSAMHFPRPSPHPCSFNVYPHGHCNKIRQADREIDRSPVSSPRDRWISQLCRSISRSALIPDSHPLIRELLRAQSCERSINQNGDHASILASSSFDQSLNVGTAREWLACTRSDIADTRYIIVSAHNVLSQVQTAYCFSRDARSLVADREGAERKTQRERERERERERGGGGR